MADGDQYVLQPVPRLLVVMDVVRRDDRQVQIPCQFDEPAVARPVPVDQVLLQLDKEVVSTEQLQVALCGCAGADNVGVCEPGYFAIAAARERDQPLCVSFERYGIERRLAPRALQVRDREQSAQVRIAAWRLREQREVRAALLSALGDRTVATPLSLWERGWG